MQRNNLGVDILVEFLKHYGVRQLVLSPGMRNIPFVVAVESDPFFVCHSVVDERNAAFFALGMAQQGGEPVGLACTSGTAVSNYLSGLTEAYYSRTPLVAVTCDRNPYALGQLETQKIDQRAALQSAVRYSCSLPVLKDEDDVWYSGRLLNEAFIALRKDGGGPVHVNLPLVGDTNAMWNEASVAQAKNRIKYIDFVSRNDDAAWAGKKAVLAEKKRIMLVMGQDFSRNARLHAALTDFCEKLKIPLLADNLANFRCKTFIHAEAVMKSLSARMFAGLLPDIVITFGLNFQERIKDLFKAHAGHFVHWAIDPDGIVRDCFKSQTAVFQCCPEEFFEKMQAVSGSPSADGQYLALWQTLAAHAVLPELPYGNFRAIGEFCRAIPEKSLLHLAILNATRLVQFFDLPPGVRVFGNVNAFGIDGCLPTFMGQAAATDALAFLVIGDISFFYAMNALSIKDRRNNIRILLVNNGGAAEFHIPPSSHAVPTIDRHIGVAHDRNAQAWAESQGYTYLSARNGKELSAGMELFVKPDSPKPVLFEVFTDMRTDGEFCLQVYRDLERKTKQTLVSMGLMAEGENA